MSAKLRRLSVLVSKAGQQVTCKGMIQNLESHVIRLRRGSHEIQVQGLVDKSFALNLDLFVVSVMRVRDPDL